jgi:hypothetical protein
MAHLQRLEADGKRSCKRERLEDDLDARVGVTQMTVM